MSSQYGFVGSVLREPINKLVEELRLAPNINEDCRRVFENIEDINHKLGNIVEQSKSRSQHSHPQNDQFRGQDGKLILQNVEDSNEVLKELLQSLKNIMPESLSKGKSGTASEDSIDIIDFSIRTDINKIEDLIAADHERNEDKEEESGIREVYTIKLEYNGSEIKENVQILFCTTDLEIPLHTIKFLMPYTKPSFNVSIPFDVFFNAQYGNLVIGQGENDLVTKEVYPIEIVEVMPIDGNLQLKIKNNVGLKLNCVILEETSGNQLEVELKAGQVGLHTFNLDSGKFSVYSSNYKRSNIVEVE